MTQLRTKILLIGSVAVFAFSLFSMTTILSFVTMIYLSSVILKKLFHQMLERGLINYLPISVQNYLMNHSLKEIWRKIGNVFENIVEKVLNSIAKHVKEYIENQQMRKQSQIYQEEEKLEHLENVNQKVIKVVPESWQKILLGREHKQIMQKHLQSYHEQKNYLKKSSQNSTSLNHQNQLVENSQKIRKASSVIHFQSKLVEYPYKSQKSHKNNSRNALLSQNKPSYKKIPFKKQGLISAVKNSIHMIKHIIQLNKLGKSIRNVDTVTILKLMIFFWGMIALQITLNKRTRTYIFKTLFIFAGILSVLGALGTTGVLIYKQCQKQQIKEKKVEKKQKNEEKYQIEDI